MTALRIWAVSGRARRSLPSALESEVGVYPPSQKFEEIPADDAHTFGITDDATEMFDHNNEAVRYRDLYIKRKDFERRLSEIKVKDGA